MKAIVSPRPRRICVVTSNRSDWSKLQPVVLKLLQDAKVEVHVIATGSHLLREFGRTIDDVKRHFPRVVEVSSTVAGDTVSSMVDSVGFGIIKISDALRQIKPDCCIIHGDRFEAFAAAVAANLSNVAVAHIEGGELSGTVDGYLRHAVTKLAHIHLACSADAAHRIKAMGEESRYIYTTGCPSYERLFAMRSATWDQYDMRKRFPNLSMDERFILALMHPCVTDEERTMIDYECLIQALFALKQRTVFLYPNLDPGNKRMIQVLHKYQKLDTDWHDWLEVVTHIVPDQFALLMRDASVMVGNSSAGVRETCVFGTPTLNIGKRQMGRLQPPNVTTFEEPETQSVIEWITENRNRRFSSSSEFGCDRSPEFVARIVSEVDLDDCKTKKFSEFQYLVPAAPIPRARLILKKMLRRPRVLGIITARGGSKGIPGKNITDLGGKPLIQFTIEAACSSDLLDRCILSTDCPLIARVAKLAGCEVPFMRPLELAQDTSSHMDCVRHAISTIADQEGYEADYAMILQPTSPFRTGKDIDNAIKIIHESSCDAVVSVTKSSVPLTKTFYVDESSGEIDPYVLSMPVQQYIRRQDAPVVYTENGAIFVQRVSSILNACKIRCGSLYSGDVKAYIMPNDRSLDIDEPYDLEIARALIAHRNQLVKAKKSGEHPSTPPSKPSCK